MGYSTHPVVIVQVPVVVVEARPVVAIKPVKPQGVIANLLYITEISRKKFLYFMA